MDIVEPKALNLDNENTQGPMNQKKVDFPSARTEIEAEAQMQRRVIEASQQLSKTMLGTILGRRRR